MVKSLFVGNLPWTISEADLKQKFEEHAKVVAVRIVTDKMSGRSKGFGFVEVEDADAAKAITAMNGAKVGERELVVNEARPRKERSDFDR